MWSRRKSRMCIYGDAMQTQEGVNDSTSLSPALFECCCELAHPRNEHYQCCVYTSGSGAALLNTNFMASLQSLRCCGFSEHKCVFRSIRKGAFLICACAEVSCSKIRKSICVLSQGKKQLCMPSEISSGTSCMEPSAAWHSRAVAVQDRQCSSRLSQLFTGKGAGSCCSLISQ